MKPKPTNEIKLAPTLSKWVDDVQELMDKDKKMTLKQAINKLQKMEEKA